MSKISFTFVNQSGPSVVEKADEEDLAVIKSHAMRAVHRQRRNSLRKDTKKIGPATLVTPITTNWEELALCRFFEDFVFPKESSTGNAFQYLNFLPNIYERDAKQSHLTAAVLAVALAHFANQASANDLHLHARRSYARSLSLVNRSLANPVEMASDHVLATLCLLAKYEVVNGDETGFMRAHEKGQAALINHRGQAQLQTEVGLGLFRLVWIRQQLNCIAQSEAPPVPPDFNWDIAFPSSHLKQLMQFVSRLVLVRYQARALFVEGDSVVAEDDTTAERLWTHEAQSLDADILRFRQSLPPELEYWTVMSCEMLPASSQVREGGKYFPEHLHLFHDLHHVSIWHVYNYCQIYLLQTLIQHASRFHHHHNKVARSAQEELSSLSATHCLRLRQAVDIVCGSVPFLLGWYNDARTLNTARRGRGVSCHYSIWVLAAALSVQESQIPDAQREWIRTQLIEIGFVHGIRHALVFT